MYHISRRSFLKATGIATLGLAATACGTSSSGQVLEVDAESILQEFDQVADCLTNWGETYDTTIAQIYQESDLAKRVDLMHQAEDMVMYSHCIMPLYFYVNTYLQKEYLTGVINTVFGMKQFGYCENSNNGNQSINLCLASEPDSLDCRLSSTVDAGCMNMQLYAGLMGTAADGSTVPSCATHYERSEDGYTYTFTLRDDLKWSDGSALNAHDFVYSWNSTMQPETGASYGYLFEGIMQQNEDGTLPVVASEDGLTLTVTLNSVCPYFLDLCAFPAFFPVHQASVEAADTDGTNPGKWALEAPFITNGPYTITAWDHKVGITLEKNPHFFDADKINIETLNFMLSDNSSSVFSAYTAGNLDFSALIPVGEIESLLGTPEYHIDEYLGTYYVGANINSELFAEMTPQQACACRKAISISIDRPYICETIGRSGQVPANCFVSAGCADGNGGIFRTNTETYTYPYADENGENLGYFDPYATNDAEALELFAAAGLTVIDNQVQNFSFEYLYNSDSGNQAIGEVIQQDMAAMGVEVSLVPQEWKVFLQMRKAGSYDIARNGWIMDYNDPINELEMWLTNSGNNDVQFGR